MVASAGQLWLLARDRGGEGSETTVLHPTVWMSASSSASDVFYYQPLSVDDERCRGARGARRRWQESCMSISADGGANQWPRAKQSTCLDHPSLSFSLCLSLFASTCLISSCVDTCPTTSTRRHI